MGAWILTLKGHGRHPTLKGHDGGAWHPFSSAGVAARRGTIEDRGRTAAYDCGRGHCDAGVDGMCCHCHITVCDRTRALFMMAYPALHPRRPGVAACTP